MGWKIASGGEIGGSVNEFCRKNLKILSPHKRNEYHIYQFYLIDIMSTVYPHQTHQTFELSSYYKVGLSVNTQYGDIFSY